MAELSDNFETMYKVHYKMLRNAAENIIGDGDAAHDVVQEVFLKLWNRKDDISVILNQKAYLFKSVINASISYLEASKNKNHVSEFSIEAPGRTDSAMMVKELELRIQAALDTLPPKCKAIFVLSRFEGLKNKEISEFLGLSIKTVENQMGIALKKMKDDLKPYLSKDSLTVLVLGGLAMISDFFPLLLIFGLIQ